MHEIGAWDVNEALGVGLQHLIYFGEKEESRNGSVLVAPSPVCTTYLNPARCVLFSPSRDANPFFHFFEALWMLSGDNDIKFPCHFNKRYAQYSDDGSSMWDAYGWRWRDFFGWDQLRYIATELRDNPTSRRCVLSMWNSFAQDLHYPSNETRHETLYTEDFYVATHGGKAVPCNTHAYLDVRHGKLNMTVCCRSNDAIWGCYGANAVQFSFLLQFMANLVGVPVGVYRQMSNNLHVYTDVFSQEKLSSIASESLQLARRKHEVGPLIDGGFLVLEDLLQFMQAARRAIEDSTPYAQPRFYSAFFNEVASPMFNIWHNRKIGLLRKENCQNIGSEMWSLACSEWLARRDGYQLDSGV